ncbi:tyrosine-protein phosphatase [Oxalobacter vibrioformis]|uniref:Tyrosine-protein phosphatase n=1 Tax=Oxalobacter vibrioformis TaxID=933080 RepID=A0A9E9LYU7_9BURK|nr:tyrosine-protein phosphatase [Oxalobacter vibrioformis]WAW10180.1 tyrosine-protein phosphatase [Oxalobacter vibrioformis]
MKDIASITRDKKTKAATLHLKKDIPWKIWPGKNTAHQASSPALSGEKSGSYSLPVDPMTHACFTLQTPEEILTLAEHHLPMAGGYNIRDLGGYRGAGGKRIAWGTFFRADDMAHLSDEDIAYLGSIPITTVFDFRTHKEVEAAPDRLPASVKNVVHRPLAPGNVAPSEIQHGKFGAYDDTDAFMRVVYRELVNDTGINATYREFFRLIQNKNDLPILFHCTAGKDRTGMAAAFLLFALGVDRDTIIRDYMDSNTYLAGKYTLLTKDNPQLAVLYSVKPDYLLTGIDTMEKAHGTVENYLARVLDADIDAIRSQYLY